MTYWMQHSANSAWLEEFPASELLQSHGSSKAVYLQMSDRWSVTNNVVIYGHQLDHWNEIRGTLEGCSLFFLDIAKLVFFFFFFLPIGCFWEWMLFQCLSCEITAQTVQEGVCFPFTIRHSIFSCLTWIFPYVLEYIYIFVVIFCIPKKTLLLFFSRDSEMVIGWTWDCRHVYVYWCQGFWLTTTCSTMCWSDSLCFLFVFCLGSYSLREKSYSLCLMLSCLVDTSVKASFSEVNKYL